MSFRIKPEISVHRTAQNFFDSIGLKETDLIVTNRCMMESLNDAMQGKCGVVVVEDFGSTEPTNVMINGILESIWGKGYQRVIAIGGGAVIDIAKQLVFADGLTCEDLYRLGAQLDKKRQLIAVPTTCGTGSEVSCISVALFEEQSTKIGLVLPQMFPDQAVLVPDLLRSLPYDVFAASSLDALVHAMESYISPKADEFSKMFSVSAIERILLGYLQIAEKGVGAVPELLENFSIASCLAGIAFSNAGCGGVHALSFPLGGTFHVPHGKANYYLFVDVFKEYIDKGADLGDLENVLRRVLGDKDVWKAFEDLLEAILPKEKLSTFGMKEEDIARFISSVIKNQQRLLVNMPVALSEDNMRAIYKRCL